LASSETNSGDDGDDNGAGEAAVLHPLFGHGRGADAPVDFFAKDASSSDALSPSEVYGGTADLGEARGPRRGRGRAGWHRAKAIHRDAFAALEAARRQKLNLRAAGQNAVDAIAADNEGSSSSSSSSSTPADGELANDGASKSGGGVGENGQNVTGGRHQDDGGAQLLLGGPLKKHSGKRSGLAMMRAGKYATRRAKPYASTTLAQRAEVAANAPTPLARPLKATAADATPDAGFSRGLPLFSSAAALAMVRDASPVRSSSSNLIRDGGIGHGGFTSVVFEI
jgi:hypothetical protein